VAGAHDQLEPIERASLDELRGLQLDRLRASVRRAYERVPHYRDALDRMGASPHIATLDDLARLPFTTKDDLRRDYPFGMLAVPMDEVVRLHASSGTTGKPTVVGYTQGDIDCWANLMARSIRAAGGRSSDKIHISYGYGLFTGGLGAHYGAEKLGAAVIPFGGGSTERQVQLIEDFKPDVIMVTPSYALVIADEFERQGLDPGRCSLRLAICGAEPWTETVRAEIEGRLGLQALDIYGLSEVMGPGVGQECAETRDGLTLWEDHFYPEIIDPETGRVLPDGEHGELVLTSLTREAMPLIRYRTRDLTRLLPGTARTMRRIDRIRGRSDDMLIIRGVNVFPTQIEAVFAGEGDLAAHYQLEVWQTGKLAELDVVVETKASLLDAERRAGLARRTEHLIKSYVGVSTTVRIVEPGTIERSQGKAKRVVHRGARPAEGSGRS
jgi:phenylacetate-CoA ligase